jgi:CRP/FNR family transcriptional regulator
MDEGKRHNRYWFLEGYDLFEKIKNADIRRFEQNTLTRKLPKGSVLHFPMMLNKYVYFLQKGVIKIAVTGENGREFIKYLIKPGNLFGEIPLVGHVESPLDYAIAIEDSVVWFIDSETMKQWMLENEDLRLNVFKQIGSRIKKVENRLLSMIFKDARTRAMEFIAQFTIEFGKHTPEGYEVKNFLTHEDIAKITATSRQTISSILNELRDQKMLDYNSKYIRIPNSSPLLKKVKPAL